MAKTAWAWLKICSAAFVTNFVRKLEPVIFAWLNLLNSRGAYRILNLSIIVGAGEKHAASS
jgi:hypothetical protein